MKPKSLTFIEVICVTVILAIVASVLIPVISNAKIGSKAESAKLNLHYFWKGLMVYQSNYDEKVPYGLPSEMGLPSEGNQFSSFVNELTGDYANTWSTKSKYLPCGKGADDQEFVGLGYMPFIKQDWPAAVKRLKNSTVLLFDKNCNAPDTRVMCQFCEKRSIGITLNGSIRDRISADWKVYDQHFYQ